jgi:hypothetical protein
VDGGVCKAANEAFEIGMYRLAAPPAGVDRDVIDRLWDPVESQLPDLIRRLETKKLESGDDVLLLNYVSMAAVRHPIFEAVATDWARRNGYKPALGDQVQMLRAVALKNQIAASSKWRWRVVHVPADIPRLTITDRGWMMIGEPDRSDCSLLVSMSPRVALLGYLDAPDLPPARPPFEEHLDLCLSWVEWVRAAMWDDPTINAVYTHPSDRSWLEAIPDHRTLRVSEFGPFRMRKSSGLMD